MSAIPPPCGTCPDWAKRLQTVLRQSLALKQSRLVEVVALRTHSIFSRGRHPSQVFDEEFPSNESIFLVG